MIHLNRGTPYIYMGEEIGMIDPDFDSIADYVDIECLNAHHLLLEKGLSKKEAFRRIKAKSRDNSRTPMQWTADENAGFTLGKPWLKVAESYGDINVEKELASPQSIFNYYQKLIRLRKQYPVIALGSYQAYQPEHPQVYSFLRQYEEKKVIVFTNFYGKETTISLPEEFLDSKILIDNYDGTIVERELKLKPYQAIALLKE